MRMLLLELKEFREVDLIVSRTLRDTLTGRRNTCKRVDHMRESTGGDIRGTIVKLFAPAGK